MWSSLEHAAAHVCGFVRRHKRAVVAAGVASLCVGGVYYGYRRVLSEAERFTAQLQRQMAEHQRLQHALASTTEESGATVRRFLPRLKKELCQRVDLEQVVASLKALDKRDKPRRNALWEQAKLAAVTRYLTALVAFALWHLLVFAQIAIIGKRTFEKSMASPAASASAAPLRGDGEEAEAVAAQHAFLASGLEYFLDEGITRIHAHVERVVATNEQLQSYVEQLVASEVSRKARVERDELNELLQSLFLSILPPPPAAVVALDDEGAEETPAYADKDARLWRSFLIYEDKKPGQNEQVISLLNDLWDLLESDLFAPALQHSLGFLCGNAFQDLNDAVYGASHSSSSSNRPTTSDNASPIKPTPPLAKLIPALQSEANKLLQSTSKSGDGESYVAKYSQGVGEVEAFRHFYEAVFFEAVDDSVAALI